MTPISVIIPSLNGEKRLPALLQSIRDQTVPQESIEILVVDDDSSDRTIEVAKRFGARVLHNGRRNIERGKAIGVAEASHEVLFFIDDDNRLPHPGWLAKAIEALESDERVVGVQAARFTYKRTDPAANRYCSIFGINDPMAYYLNRRDRLTVMESQWTLPGQIIEESSAWWTIEFKPHEFLTIGSQGYLTRRSLMQRTDWWPYLFHIDSNYELVREGFNRFILLKDEVVHDHCLTASQLIKKLHRNMRLFLEQSHMRRFRWETPTSKLVAVTLEMMTVVSPLLLSIRAFLRTRDPACFLHPYLCVRIPSMYMIQMAQRRLLSRS